MKKLIGKIIPGIREAFLPFWKKPWRIAVLFILLTAWIIVGYVVYDTTINPRYTAESMGITGDQPVAEMTRDVTITQSLQTKSDIDGISIMFATYGSSKTSHYKIVVDDISNSIRVFDKTVSASVSYTHLTLPTNREV